MQEGVNLVFIEVRARQRHAYGDGAASVTQQKQRKIRNTASLYLQQKGLSLPCRFDVVSVHKTESGWHFDWIRDAFY